MVIELTGALAPFSYLVKKIAAPIVQFISFNLTIDMPYDTHQNNMTIATLGIMILSTMTLSIMALRITTISIKFKKAALRIITFSITALNSLMLSVIYSECQN